MSRWDEGDCQKTEAAFVRLIASLRIRHDRLQHGLVLDVAADDRRKALVERSRESTSLSAIADATESGLRTNTTVSARRISASMRCHHSSNA
jgi:hypothetical protein